MLLWPTETISSSREATVIIVLIILSLYGGSAAQKQTNKNCFGLLESGGPWITTVEKTNTCTYRRHPTYHWRPHTIQAIRIQAARHRRQRETDISATIRQYFSLFDEMTPLLWRKRNDALAMFDDNGNESSQVISSSMAEKITLMILCSIKNSLQQIR